MKKEINPAISKGFIADLSLGIIAIFLGLLFVYNPIFSISSLEYYTKFLVYFTGLIFALAINKTWESVWRWTSLDDLMRVLRAVILSATIYIFIIYFSIFNLDFTLPLIVSFFMVSLMMGMRGIARFLSSGGNFMALSALFKPILPGAPAAILVGETDVITKAIHEARKAGPLAFKPIAIISTLGNHVGKVYAGARVYSGNAFERNLKALVASGLNNYPSVRVILVGDAHSDEVTQGVMNVITDSRVRLSRIPEFGYKELLNVNPEDVLGRKRHVLNPLGPSSLVNHRTVLVTGGGGTIGSELVLQIAQFNPAKIVIVDSSESNLYTINQMMSEKFPAVKVIIRLKDIRDYRSIDDLFETYQPQIVFHAAANKHVPLLEEHPREAIMVNLGGTKNVADAALRFGTQVFVLISTDKAVNPSNLMGAAKRSAELYTRYCFEKHHKQFFSTRFGNVLGSSGSVMPLFEKQITNMGPVTITSRDMTRWFMTVGEAVGLVLQAAALGGGVVKDKDGQLVKIDDPLFVLDMGAPVRIVDFAEAMIRLRGYEPYRDIKIIETGIRPGEKLREELFYKSERVSQTPLSGILSAQPIEPLPENLIELIDKAIKAATKNDIPEALKYLEEIVPEFKHEKRK